MNPLSIKVHIEVMEVKKYCEVCKIETIHIIQVVFLGNSLTPVETGMKYCGICDLSV